jgi:hypothetical protein
MPLPPRARTTSAHTLTLAHFHLLCIVTPGTALPSVGLERDPGCHCRPTARASSRQDYRPSVARSSAAQTAEDVARDQRGRDDGGLVGCWAIWGRSALPVNGQILNYGASRAPFGARSNN